MAQAIVLSDIHLPYEDKRALSTALEFTRKIKPDTIILGGDILDCYPLSTFHRVPSAPSLHQELEAGKNFLKELRRQHRNADITFIFGNHESRFEKRILERLPELHGSVALSELLELDELDIIPVTEPVDNTSVHWRGVDIAHYDIAGSNAPRKIIADIGVSTVQCHTHHQSLTKKRYKDRTITVVENGCLCGLDPQYVKNPNWQHGFSYLIAENGMTTIIPIQIQDGKINY